MVEPGWVDHDQSKDNADWIEKDLEKDQIATESEEMVFNNVDPLNHRDYETYQFEYNENFNVNLCEMVSNIREGLNRRDP